MSQCVACVSVCALVCQIREKLEFPSGVKNQSLSAMNQLLIGLRFYATGSFQLVVGDTFNVSKSTICHIVHRVTSAIPSLREKYVKFPTTVDDQRRTMQSFYSRSKMPGIIDVIDCTHVAIQSPGSNDAEIYRNRKGFFSINVQLVCELTGYITDVVARWPGSVHDSTIFDNSHLRAVMETQQTQVCLVGDGGYACRRYMLTPLNNPTTAAEHAYNAAQILARNCIERTIGMLKRRYPALKYGLHLKLKNTLPVIVACVVLHNIAVTLGEEEPAEDDDELQQYVTEKRFQLLTERTRNPSDEADIGQHTDTAAAANQPASTSVRRALIDEYFAG